jgi:hypothetical protein
MERTVTFSFSSKTFESTEARETFTFKELGIREDLKKEEEKEEIERIYQSWVWDKLNISYSIVIGTS